MHTTTVREFQYALQLIICKSIKKMSRNKNKGSKSSESTENQGTDLSVFLTVFSYCLLIILLPVISFFGSKKIFDQLDITAVSANIYAAICAVVCLHLALGLYLYRAYTGSDKPKPKPAHQAKQD